MLTSGQIVGEKYRVERVIGRGGMGVVYAARHVLLDELVALKVIAPEIAHRGTFSTRFVREARAASKIRSEHVVRVTDVGVQDDGTLYMAMELLEGSDLDRLIHESGALREADAVQYVLQALVALGEAHALGMVHRDLKPANLFLTTAPDGRPIVKILDFGISKTEGTGETRVTATDTIIGSPTYMSPEQLRGARTLDHRADIWSMGVVLFELLTAHLPFPGQTAGAVFAAILETPAPPVRARRPDASARVEAVVARCLEKDAAGRFENVAELAQALAQLTPDGDSWAERVRRSLTRTALSSGPLAKPEASEQGSGPMARVRTPDAGGGTAALESAPTIVQAIAQPAPTPARTTEGHAVQSTPTPPATSRVRTVAIGATALAIIGAAAVFGAPRLLGRGPKAATVGGISAATVASIVPSVAPVASSAPSVVAPVASSAASALASVPPLASSAPATPASRRAVPGTAARPRPSADTRPPSASTPTASDPFPDQRK